MTKAEACLWKYALRAKGMKGYTFRRERPVLNYIADFMCMELKLVIEVDGLTHQWEETVIKDAKKDADLMAAGFTVLRFDDNDILTQLNKVIERIEDTMVAIENKNHPNPRPPMAEIRNNTYQPCNLPTNRSRMLPILRWRRWHRLLRCRRWFKRMRGGRGMHS
jgi:very-short-patch-repair endonuclease